MPTLGVDGEGKVMDIRIRSKGEFGMDGSHNLGGVQNFILVLFGS